MMSRKFVSGLIELYKKNTCLWKSTIPEYTNKYIKNEAYNELVGYSKPFFEEADIFFVKNKIQNLRTAFRKEYRKVEESRRSATDENSVYMPHLWYYDLLLFTADYTMPRDNLEGKGNVKEQQDDTIVKSESIELDFEEENEDENEELEEETDNCSKVSQLCSSERCSFEESRYPSSSLFKEPVMLQDEITPKRRKDDEFFARCQQLKKIFSDEEKANVQKPIDEFDAIGISWAAKLRKLDDVQKVLAEDLINQVLKKGFFRELTRATQISEGGIKNNIICNISSSEIFTDQRSNNNS